MPSLLLSVSFSPLQGFASILCLYEMHKYQFMQILNNLKNKHVQQKKRGLVHGMHSNGPLHQVSNTFHAVIAYYYLP